MVKDKYPRVRSSTVEALADTGSVRAIPVLQSVVNDEEGRIRAMASRKLYPREVEERS
ncbi:MAG: HEAT repeat domain-containing protein [Metallosphaera sp.]